MVEDLENARGSLHQDFPLLREACTYLYIPGHFCVPLDSHSYQEFTGTCQDTLLRPSRTGPRLTAVLGKVRARKVPILLEQRPKLYKVSPVPS